MSALTTAQKTDIANYVNVYRAKNQAPPMMWDESIYTVAKNWSNRIAEMHVIQHSGNNSYGENIAFFQGYGSDPVDLIKKAISRSIIAVAPHILFSPIW